MKNFFRFSTAAFAAAIAALQQSPSVNAQFFKTVDEAYNPDEERGSFDLVMKPYPIPTETTTYVDFFFNLPDDLPDLFHVTFGEVINSQPQHLHHFFVFGCPNKVDPSQDGVAAEFDTNAIDCTQFVAGWAPGSDVFGNTDLETGIILGKGLGMQSLQMNVHYTDGVYADEAQKTLKMATDGIRVHYTSNFRPYTSIYKSLISVPSAPRELTIPPGESRFFLSRTCKVDTNCKDANQNTIDILAYIVGMSGMDVQGALGGADFSCESLQPLCNLGGEIGSYILQLCPSTCGLCEKGTDGAVNPLNPETYRITDIQYHAHLLGREMYTTLLRDEEEPDNNTTLAIERQTPTTNTIAKDLESREFWIFDNQETIPLDFDVFENDTIMRGTEIKAGDKIQTTCVFDSTDRTDPTRFYLSTYDEMCIISTRVTTNTPASWMNGGEPDATSALDLATELHLMSFNCLDDAEGDVYSGILTADEDGRDIWKDHPIDEAEGCTYSTFDFLFGGLTQQTRNCGFEYDENPLCGWDAELLSDNNAGATCVGGTLDQQDANAGVTEDMCANGGGYYQPYSCGDANSYLQSESDLDQATIDFLVNDYYRSKCCSYENLICGPDMEFLSENNAGTTCVGGTLDQKDAMEGVTEEDCQNGGGVYIPYSCGDSNDWLKYEAEDAGVDQAAMDFWANEWWKPKCCDGDFSESSSEDESSDVSESSSEDESSDVESLEVESESEAIVSAAAPGFANSPWGLLSAVSAVGILSVVLWG